MLLLITIASLLLAMTMSVVAWRASREERRRSAARVAALAADIHDSIDFELRPEHEHPAPSTQDPAPNLPHDLFTPAASHTRGAGWGVALAAGGLVVATVAALAIMFGGGSPTVAGASRATPAAAAPATTAAPLELVALAHERDGDSLTVRGVVRNPPTGVEMDHLVAVVFLFNRDGGFLTSGRAAVESPALIPGGESTFVVTVPASADLGRYRVSFRADDRIISHVDRRSRS